MLEKKRQNTILLKLLMITLLLGWGLTFQSPPVQAQEGEKPIYPGYPLGFDGTGSLDGLAADKIVVNDAGFKLASDVLFNQPDFLNSGPKGFRTGDTIGFVLNSKGEIESVWLLKRNPKKK